tara:strand:+ start:17 stop:943 length:927 start_codon:yes stop_codon:yes gene_type:complete
MAYVGTPIDVGNQFSSLVGKRFSGDASTVAFTLDVRANSALDIEVFVENVRQDPNSAYTVDGTTLTFTAAPPSGTNNIYVVHQAPTVASVSPTAGSVTASSFDNSVISGHTALASEPADTDEFLVSDAGTIKRIDYSLIKAKGKIAQVVTTTFTGTESTQTEASSGNFTDSSVAASITPTATSSKIMVMCTINAGSTDSSNGVHVGRFTQAISGGSTTAVFVGAAASNRVLTSSGRGTASTNENTILTKGFNFVLTPSTTSAVTVTYQFTARGAAGTNTVYINRSATDSDTTEYQRTASAITLMEILA